MDKVKSSCLLVKSPAHLVDPCFRSPNTDSDVTSESLEASDSASAGSATANGTKEMSDYHDDFDGDDDHDVATDGDDGDIREDADAGHKHCETRADGVTDTRED